VPTGFALAGADDLPLVVVRRVGDAVDDLELASRTRGRRLADGDAIEADDPSVFKQRQLAVGNADQNPVHSGSGERGFGELRSLGTRRGGDRRLQGLADGGHCEYCSEHCAETPECFFLPIRFAGPQFHRIAPVRCQNKKQVGSQQLID
jgi:hypothetical protein